MRIICLLLCCTLCGYAQGYTDSINQKSFQYLKKEITSFTQQKGLDQQICFLLDLSLHNGKKRFFVYDINNDKIVQAGLVAHGNCLSEYLPTVMYSNVNGSQCSSFGRYKIGMRYTGMYGKAYKLHGLDSSNSNAYDRSIVLHANTCIPEQETHPDQICNSQGCTTVAAGFLKTLSTYIQKSRKPILLWVLAPRR